MATPTPVTPRQRMLNAYRGVWSDHIPVAPEFWKLLPAKIMGLDMIAFQREVPLWKGLLETVKHYGSEGWCVTGPSCPNPKVESKVTFEALGEGRYLERVTTRTPHGTLTSARNYDRIEPSWIVERPLKRWDQDLAAWLDTLFPPIELHDYTTANDSLRAVGEDYLLEVSVGSMFFDMIAAPMGLQEGILALTDHEDFYADLLQRTIEYMVAETRAICEHTLDAPLFIGSSWACASLTGPRLWRRWDKPLVKAIADEAHRYGRQLHVHYHGKCMENLADLVEAGVDCICPFERLPGGDVTDLHLVRRILTGKTAMNGNVHTVETLIRGIPQDVEREVLEIAEAFAGEPRLIIGTGDQVGRDTPDENIWAMVEAARRLPVGKG
jgi:uroporphyrinogen decarboxylase